MRQTTATWVMAMVLSVPAAAGAQSSGESPAVERGVQLTGAASGSMRSRTTESLILPDDVHELKMGFRFLTSPVEDMGMPAGIEFNDIALVELQGREALGEKLEIYVGASLLAKQPSTSDESVLQGAHLGARLALGEAWAAGMHAGYTPLLGELGYAGEGGGGVETKQRLNEILLFQGGLGGSYTMLSWEGQDALWFAEATGRTELIVWHRFSPVSGWFGLELRVPVAGRDGGDMLDYEEQLNIDAGAVYSLNDRWDLYFAYTLLDRGDSENPASQLPILGSGFDQSQWSFGLVRRFESTGQAPTPL